MKRLGCVLRLLNISCVESQAQVIRIA